MTPPGPLARSVADVGSLDELDDLVATQIGEGAD